MAGEGSLRGPMKRHGTRSEPEQAPQPAHVREQELREHCNDHQACEERGQLQQQLDQGRHIDAPLALGEMHTPTVAEILLRLTLPGAGTGVVLRPAAMAGGIVLRRAARVRRRGRDRLVRTVRGRKGHSSRIDRRIGQRRAADVGRFGRNGHGSFLSGRTDRIVTMR